VGEPDAGCLPLPGGRQAIFFAIGRRALFLVAAGVLLSLPLACRSARGPTQADVRRSIENLGLTQIESRQLQVSRLAMMEGSRAVVEANLGVVLVLTREKGANWRIEAVRLGDRNWIDMKTFLAVLAETQIRDTRASLGKIATALALYRQQKGSYPETGSIGKLTDLLVPAFLVEVVRLDAWNREILYERTPQGDCLLRSLGADALAGSDDDILVPLP
jgi:hypothetical protein